MALHRTPNGYSIKTGDSSEINILAIDVINAETTALLNNAPLNSLAIAAADVFEAGSPADLYKKISDTHVLADDWVRFVSTNTLIQDIADLTSNSVDLDTMYGDLTTATQNISDLQTAIGEIPALPDLSTQALSAGTFYKTVTVGTTATTFGWSFYTQKVCAVKFIVSAWKTYTVGETDTVRRETAEILVTCDSSQTIEATETDIVPYAILEVGGSNDIAGLSYTATLSGSGSEQVITLNVQKDSGETETVYCSATVVDWVQTAGGYMPLADILAA